MQIITNESRKELKEHGSYQFPLLVSQECLSQYESGSFLWHWHPEIELTLIQEGQIRYQVNNYTFYLRQGQALFGNVNALHTGHMIDHQDCRYMSITFDPKLIYGYDGSLIHEKYVNPLIQSTALPAVAFDLTEEWHREAIAAMNQIIELHHAHYPAAELDIICRLQEFWKLMYVNIRPAALSSPHDQVNYERIRMILAYIDRHYTEKITLADVAGQVHLCTSECSRLFRQYMKQSLFEFILEYRIEKSLSFLAVPTYSITQIAAETGFSDSNYFAKVFLKVKGCSPTIYRKRLSQTEKP